MNLKVLLIEVVLLSLAHRPTLCDPTTPAATPASAGASLPTTAETESEPAQSTTSVQVEENISPAEETTVQPESTAVQITTTEVLETATPTATPVSAEQTTGRLTPEQTEADHTADESQTAETAPSTPASYSTVALTSISELNSETETVSTVAGSAATSAVAGHGDVNISMTEGGESISSVTNVGQTTESSVTTRPVRTLNTPSNEIETHIDTTTVTEDNTVSFDTSNSSETAVPTTVSTTTTGTHTVQIIQNSTTTVLLSTEAASTTKPSLTTDSASITPSTPDNQEHRSSAASSTVTEESPSTAGVTGEPKTTGATEDTSESAVSEEMSVAPLSLESLKSYDEMYQRFLTAAVLSTVLINVVFLIVTSYCVYKIVRKHYFYSWDPPPVRYGSVDYGISMGRRNMGLDLSPETHDGIPPPPRITHENAHLNDRDSSIPIVITNEDGWCVPYAEAEDSRQLQNQKQSLEEEELQDMSQSPQHGTRKHNGGTAERNSFDNGV